MGQHSDVDTGESEWVDAQVLLSLPAAYAHRVFAGACVKFLSTLASWQDCFSRGICAHLLLGAKQGWRGINDWGKTDEWGNRRSGEVSDDSSEVDLQVSPESLQLPVPERPESVEQRDACAYRREKLPSACSCVLKARAPRVSMAESPGPNTPTYARSAFEIRRGADRR